MRSDGADHVERLQEEVDKGNLTMLVVAASAELACEWHEQGLIDLKAALSHPSVRIFLSPVLTKPPLQLLECLDEYFKKELLGRTDVQYQDSLVFPSLTFFFFMMKILV